MDSDHEFEELRVEHSQLEREFQIIHDDKLVDIAAHHRLVARLRAHRSRLADWLLRFRAAHPPSRY